MARCPERSLKGLSKLSNDALLFLSKLAALNNRACMSESEISGAATGELNLCSCNCCSKSGVLGFLRLQILDDNVFH